MGFKAPTGTKVTLEFGDDFPALQGAEVHCHSTSLGEVNAMDDMALDEMITYLVEHVIITWNLVDDADEPIPVTVEAVNALEPWIAFAIRGAWYRAVMTPPTSTPSMNGASSAAASVPMEAL